MKNPWADRWERMGNTLYTRTDPGEAGMHRVEAEDARSRGARNCPNGHKAYYKPGVGAFKCPECGLLETSKWNGKHGAECRFDVRWV